MLTVWRVNKPAFHCLLHLFVFLKENLCFSFPFVISKIFVEMLFWLLNCGRFFLKQWLWFPIGNRLDNKCWLLRDLPPISLLILCNHFREGPGDRISASEVPDVDERAVGPFAAFWANHLAVLSRRRARNQQIYSRKCIYGPKWLF